MRISHLLLLLFLLLVVSKSGVAAPKDLQGWIDLPVEVHDELIRKLKAGKKYSEEQLETITHCLKESDVRQIVNCLSDDGLEDALAIGYLIKEEMGKLRDRVCGGSSMGEKDRCQKLQQDLAGMGDRILETWSQTLASGEAYLEKRTALTRLKRQICHHINEKDCWTWLNERLDLHCSPEKLGRDAEQLRQCRMDVAQDIWNRLNAKN
ncbi:hypothetical protein KKI24_10060 [bacterium]|nr:hypothetical protein [bacterium]